MSANTIKKRLCINIALLSSVVLIASWLWLNPVADPQRPKLVSPLDKDLIKTIRIEAGTKPALEFSKQDDGWQIKQPIEIAANNFRVNTVLNLLTAHAHSRYDAGDIDPAEFGLQPARAVIKFNEHVFKFGNIEPIGKKRYLLFDNSLLLVDDTIFPLATSSMGSFVNNRLLPEDVQPLEFRLPDFSVNKTAAGGWRITPDKEPLSADSLQNWVDAWQYAQAIYVERQQPAVTEAEIVVRLQDAADIVFTMAKAGEDNALYRADVGLKYILTEESMTALTGLPTNDPVAGE